jgi:hypothetical protein
MSNSSETYVNSQNNMIYVLLRSILPDGNGFGHELDSLYIFDSNTKNLLRVLNPRTGLKAQTILTNEGHNSHDINQISGDIWMTDHSKKVAILMNSHGDVIRELPIRKSCAHIAINPVNNKLYLVNSGLFKSSLEIKYLN